MLKGFSTPLSPEGRANLAPSPPWHYVGSFLVVEFWAPPEAVAALLPEGLRLPSQEAGRCWAYFGEWQACTDGGEELLDPVMSQYRECIILADADFQGEVVTYCPYIFVDQDISLMRGLIQGWPKQFASIYVTRSYGVRHRASPTLELGGRFGATVAVKDRRLVEASVTLEEEHAGPAHGPALTLRYFPSLEQGPDSRPSVHELVRTPWHDFVRADVWKGQATLIFHPSPRHELDALQPERLGAGYRFVMGLTVRNYEVVRDYLVDQEVNR